MRDFKIGDKVVLTDAMKRIQVKPERFESGIVTYVGSWNVVYVKWNGTDKAIGMRAYEIEKAE